MSATERVHYEIILTIFNQDMQKWSLSIRLATIWNADSMNLKYRQPVVTQTRGHYEKLGILNIVSPHKILSKFTLIPFE